MRTKILLLFLLGWVGMAFGQEFKGKDKIYISPHASKEYSVYYTNEKVKDSVRKVFNRNGNLQSFELEERINWKNAKELTTSKLKEYNWNKFFLNGNISPEKGRLVINFWNRGTISDSLRNFLSTNHFSIPLEENDNLSFFADSFHLGAMTLPLKIYLTKRDNNVAGGMAEGNTNIGIYAGYKFGWRKYVKLKHEKEYRVYNIAFSSNAIVGLGKVTVDDKNSVGNSQIWKVDVPSFNLGIAFGLHYRDFSLLVAYGIDILMSRKGENWNYKDKPWLGIGIGYKIF
ncbi:hypothetical protein [Chryseobacterium sp. CFS15]|uniref:hypothetical protein n=1 Tax=Chryseobacterium sp. CFS15 TaxID=2986946 RepID=UPI00280A448F|nr:hypothetical protein [Chryseobacterium sp. CFS15]MDQ8142781.1 hypothetical protein [Chryseobacterium sp. CFS15]